MTYCWNGLSDVSHLSAGVADGAKAHIFDGKSTGLHGSNRIVPRRVKGALRHEV